jgi:hypothetical protein
MTTRIETLALIRDLLVRNGPADASTAARSAFENGSLDRLDLPEVMLALRARSASFIAELATNTPGRLPFSATVR